MNRLLHANMGHGTSLLVRASVLVLLIGGMWLAPQAVAQAAKDRLATPDELRQMHDAGQYHVCLQQVARILRAGNAGTRYDRYDLLLLRGDCLLHLDDPATAKIAYLAAAKSPDPEQAREGRATAFLLHRTEGM